MTKRASIATLSPELLDQSLPTPLYHQIYLLLRERIRTGAFTAQSVLPSEQELTRLLGVSRITVKRALNELAAHGLVLRHRGRGTIVTYNTAYPLVKGDFSNLIDSLRTMGLETEIELLEVTDLTAPPEVADLMGLPPGADVQRAVRLRKLQAEPFSYLITYVPADIAASFSRAQLASEPLLRLLDRAGAQAAEAEQILTATAAEPAVAQALRTAIGSPLLSIQRIMRDQSGRAIQLIMGFYRPDRFQYHMRLTRQDGQNQNVWRAEE
jgi:GntR family transcriptional regulator